MLIDAAAELIQGWIVVVFAASGTGGKFTPIDQFDFLGRGIFKGEWEEATGIGHRWA